MSTRLFVAVMAVGLALACDKMDSPSAPTQTAALGLAAQPQSGQAHDRMVIANDACDPDTFNAAIGPGTCVGNGGVTFANFIDQLTRLGRVPSWFFAPPNATANVGDEFVVRNRGGETHTFTEVEDFGGGIVPSLNAIMHLGTVAPECRNLDPDDFIAPGGTYREDISEGGLEKYQCCIHPWMRLEARIK